ncbi:MAG: DUF5989 family protein [Candidatus Omnitrophica bacterium]|nr:DUF5989 family protein [Candidatus Omnitrophota bacterium]
MTTDDKNETPSKPEPLKKKRVTNNKELLIELFLMIKEHKKWWLLPLLLVLAFLSIFVNLAGNSSILPAIYALF